MEGFSEFSRFSWEGGSVLEPIQLAVDSKGKAIPQIRVTTAGKGVHRGGSFMYLMLMGFVERIVADVERKDKTELLCYGALPLGVGEVKHSNDEILKAASSLDVTVRRTAGSGEQAVFGIANMTEPLIPWYKGVKTGIVLSAIKTLSMPNMIPLGQKVKLRVLFVTGTRLGETKVYKIPKTLLNLKMPSAISFNLEVVLATTARMIEKGVKPTKQQDGKNLVSVLLHVGHFKRNKDKVYSVEYCQKKVDNMRLEFSLGSVGGVSFHVMTTGKMSKALFSSVGFSRSICYALVDVNPALNAIMWAAQVEIHRVCAVFQPSIPEDFKFYDDVIIDKSGKIFKGK